MARPIDLRRLDHYRRNVVAIGRLREALSKETRVTSALVGKARDEADALHRSLSALVRSLEKREVGPSVDRG